jgi:hypothetical protein
MYIEADLAMKKRALDKLAQPRSRTHRLVPSSRSWMACNYAAQLGRPAPHNREARIIAAMRRSA